MFLRRGAVDVGNVQRHDVHERGYFQRADAVVCSLSVVPRGLVAVESRRIDCSVASAFLRSMAEKRTLQRRRKLLKSATENGEVRQWRETDFVENAWHLA
jgi:hypothetical protein